MATGPFTSPCCHHLPPVEAIAPFPPPSPLLQPLFYREEVGKGFSGGALALLLPIPSQLAQPCLRYSKPSTLHPIPLSAMGGEREEEKEEEEGDEEPSRELIAG